MASLSLKNIYKVYEGGVRAVSDFNLEIADKEFVVFVGPSGCGKSTTLRMIAGLEEITAGDLCIDGVRINDVEPKDRNIAMVFQNYALYPHMTVFQNMAFGLKLRKIGAQEIEKRVVRAAEILGISELLTRKPKALSGGQRQRVALGRAIVREPNVFLLDEPLSNLDAKLRVQMRTEITKLHKRLSTTFIYVTHDQTEAMTMGDRIVVMKDGFIQQADTPAILYEQPCNVFVATFLGSPEMNIFSAKLEKEGVLKVRFGVDHEAKFSEIKSRQLSDITQIGKEVLFGVRPENVSITEDGIKAKVDVVEHLGSETIVYASVEGLEKDVVAKIPTDHSIVAGQDICLTFDMDKCHIFDAQSKHAVMGVPAVNTFPCSVVGDELHFNATVHALPENQVKRLFDFARSSIKYMQIRSDRVSLEEIPESLSINCKVEFTVTGSDSTAVYTKVNGQDGYFVFRVKKTKIADGDEITVYAPYSAVALCTEEGVRCNSREIVSCNTAPCVVKTENGVSTVVVGNNKLVYDDLGISDGEHKLTLKSDKLGFVYGKKYAKKNKVEVQSYANNVVRCSAYDEDLLGGGKNAVFVRVNGWDNYVTAVLDDKFSVYKMPEFGIYIPKEAVEIN